MSNFRETSVKFRVILLLVLLHCIDGRWYDEDSLKDPTRYFTECGNTDFSYVCNPDAILTTQEVSALNKTIQAIVDNTTCPCVVTECSGPERSGYLFAIAIVRNLATNDSDESVQDLADALRRNHWQLGDCGNDALIIVTSSSEEVFVSAGHVMRMSVNPACLRTALKIHRGNFTQGNWAAALTDLVDALGTWITEGCPTDTTSTSVIIGVLIGAWMLIIVLAVVALRYTSSDTAECTCNPRGLSLGGFHSVDLPRM